jgi:hypothetical protein
MNFRFFHAALWMNRHQIPAPPDPVLTQEIKHKQAEHQLARLQKILFIAEQICDENPEALRSYIYLLGRKLQSDFMLRAVSLLDENSMPDLVPKEVWFNEHGPLTETGEGMYRLIQEVEASQTMHLQRDLVLPWPWNISRVISALTNIGEVRASNAWKQDTSNHRVTVWLPLGIGWIYGGNHSTMAGIVQGAGQLEASTVYDMSALFKLVRFDGTNFIRTHDGAVISTPVDFEFACIFEVGRLMHKRGINI